MSVPDKFQFIDKNLYGTWKAAVTQGIFFPLTTTLLLIYVYPIPAKYVYEYWRKQQRKLKEIQQQIDDETPLTKEEARQLRRELLNATGEFEQELERRTSEINRLKEQLNEMEGKLSPSTTVTKIEIDNPKNNDSQELDDQQLSMLKLIANSNPAIFQKNLISLSNDRIRSEYNIGELERLGYILKNYASMNSDYKLKATHSGRAYIVRNSPPVT